MTWEEILSDQKLLVAQNKLEHIILIYLMAQGVLGFWVGVLGE